MKRKRTSAADEGSFHSYSPQGRKSQRYQPDERQRTSVSDSARSSLALRLGQIGPGNTPSTVVSTLSKPMAPYGRSNGANRGGGFGGPPSKRGRANGGGSAPAPSAPGPIRNQAHILANYYSAAGPRAKNKPSAQSISKYMDNSKGVISNYITTLGEQVSYRGGKVTVDGTPVFR